MDDTAAAVRPTRLVMSATGTVQVECREDRITLGYRSRTPGRAYSVEAQLGSSGLSVQFGTEVISASDHVRVLGVTISSDLSLDKHVADVCSSAGCRFSAAVTRWTRST